MHSQKTRYLPERASCLQTQTHHLIIHDYTAVSLACLPVSYCWPFAWVHRTSSEVCLVIKLYRSFLHELFPHFLCLRHQASLDDITHVAKSVRSVRRGPLWGQMGINESTVKHRNYFYNRIILVLLYQNDVKVNSGLVYLYMHFDIIFVEHH